MRKDKTRRGLPLRDDIRHGGLRDGGLDERIGAASPPDVKKLFHLRFREVFWVGDDRQKLQLGFTGVVHAEPYRLNAMVGQRRAKVTLAFVVGQNSCANGYGTTLPNFGAGNE